MKSCLLFISWILPLVLYLKSHCCTQGHLGFLLCYLIGVLQFVCYIRSMIHLICVLWDIGVQLHSFACGHSAVPASFVETTIRFSLTCLLIPIKSHLITNWSIYYLNSQLYILDWVSTFTPIPRYLDYCCSVVNFEISKYESFNFIYFFPKLFWIYWVSWISTSI